ncbi:MAG: hypothetical protein WAJ93_02075 [Candidatus Nitrosopolaris sp.]
MQGFIFQLEEIINQGYYWLPVAADIQERVPLVFDSYDKEDRTMEMEGMWE